MDNKGFTLIELIVVLVLLSVLVVTIQPKINTTSDFTYISQRDQTISLLRNVQQRAMQNTQNSETCHRVSFTTGTLGLTAQNNDGTCAAGLKAVAGNTDDYLLVELEDSYSAKNAAGVALSNIQFNYLGQPIPNLGSCATSGCVITISTDHSVCIESEGYIHVCP
ncbi:MAG: MSHA pilin protein MshC [Psychrosphaera sp.]|jgi:MSHA pilin protein MshC